MNSLMSAMLIICCALRPTVDETANLIANPSFEVAGTNNTVAEDWATREGIVVVRQTDGGRTGTASVRFQDDRPDQGQMLESRRIPARPGGTYTTEAWFRTADTCRPGIYLNFYDAYGQRVVNRYERATGPTDDWQKVTVSETAPADAWEVSVALYAYVGDVGTFDADDVRVTVHGGAEPGSMGVERAVAGEKAVYEIGDRRELFVDDFLIDGQSGHVRRQLQHPSPREVVLQLNQPWEGETSAYFAMVQDGERILMYYRGQVDSTDSGQVCCVAESHDGIHFRRVSAGVVEFQGATDNNIVWKGVAAHNFTPFLDSNPDAPPEERFKAMGYSHHGRGLGVFASPDGIHWRELLDHPVITNGAFDSQNLAFWDPLRKCYVDFHRKGRDGVRDIMTCTSTNFREWTEPVFLEYNDSRREHLYTNGIFAYSRAPHLYIGLPARFVPERKKIAEHAERGVSDAVLMSSRDGLRFDRWSQAFIRPGTEPEVWTDRNNYPAWNVIQTSPEEVSVYWTEHYRHPGMRLRRGVIRTDGFASLHAEDSPGEIITRPLKFAGSQLQVNYATDATGWIRFELCDHAGQALSGFSLYESEVLFGNEVQHPVTWKSGGDLSSLANQSVRLRICLHNADVYSLRFAE
ncbi:MAG: hypothetical protein KDA96_15935 [Planctomycetaceae bacterium]|nr:hypothetical protein [Planctomycetaceae bacterium]